MKIPGVKYFFSELFNFNKSTRSDRARKNIIILFVLHFLNFIVLMITVPVAIGYLGETDYGIWLTLASILGWLINLDLGIGNGLRNKLAEALALGDMKLARTYVSTAYSVFSVGIICAFTLYLFLQGFFNWADLLNAPPGYFDLLNNLVLYIITLFLVQFLLKLITSVINADQSPALNGTISLSTNFITLLSILLLSEYSVPSLTAFGLVASSVPVLTLAAASGFLFSKRFRKLSPAFSYVNFSYSSGLIKLGLQFFIIQISSLIVFTTGNVIITQLYGPDSVVVYNIAYKYFYLVPMVFNVVLAPFWSAFTDAYVKNEFEWIKNSVRKLIIVWLLLSVIAIAMIAAADIVYVVWVGADIEVPFLLSALSGIFVIIANWNNIFFYFISGVGKLRLQLYYSIITAVINIPLSILLAEKAGLGISGVMLSTIICLISASVLIPLQYKKILSGSARGIWGK